MTKEQETVIKNCIMIQINKSWTTNGKMMTLFNKNTIEQLADILIKKEGCEANGENKPLRTH